MRDWGLILGGLVLWTLHFVLIYGLASIADVSDPATAPVWVWLGVAGTGLALAATAWVGVEALSKRTRWALTRYLGAGGAVLAAVSIVFQSLPLFIAS